MALSCFIVTKGKSLDFYYYRKTPIACNALAYRKNGIIEVKRGHHGHERQDALANAKLVRYSIRQSAVNSDASTSDIIRNAHDAFGDSISMTCTQQSLARMINRARQPAPERKLDWGGNDEHAIFDETAVKNEPQSPGPEMGGQYRRHDWRCSESRLHSSVVFRSNHDYSDGKLSGSCSTDDIRSSQTVAQ
uniref:Uncharacterized protein n=1 Tax=Caenorhabditis japonica TaxID=281687 RepID=A0A8R1E7F2_CAEJA